MHERPPDERLRGADQRRLLRDAAGRARLDRAGRRVRRGDVREADPARRGRRLRPRRVLRADGHDQGSPVARGAPRVRARALAHGRGARPTAPSRDATARLGRAGAAPQRPRDRRSLRRHRDRLWRDDPLAGARPGPRLESTGWSSPRTGTESTRRGRAPRRSSPGLREPTVEILVAPDGYLPYEASEVKDTFEALKARIDPDLVLTHTRDDLHQDHRLVCDLTWNTFRDHLVLEYEIPKYDGDLGRPNAFVRSRGRRRRAKAGAARGAFREPAVEGLVRRRRLPRADASARDGVSLTERVRGGIHRTEALDRGGRLTRSVGL